MPTLTDYSLNPYANKDGTVIVGREADFFAWAKDVHDKALATLPTNIQDDILKGEERLAARMNS